MHSKKESEPSTISAINSVKRGQIQKGYTLNAEMDKLISWLITISESYSWQGNEFFPSEGDIRETNVKNGAKQILDAILKTETIWNNLPDRYNKNGKKISKPAWKGPLYYWIRTLFDSMSTGTGTSDFEEFVYMDYEEQGYSAGPDPTARWKAQMRRVLRVIKAYQDWLVREYSAREGDITEDPNETKDENTEMDGLMINGEFIPWT